MGKSFIISDKQLQTIVESQLNESEYVIYNIKPDQMNPGTHKIFFNRLGWPNEGYNDWRTKKIIFRLSTGEQFEFDADKVVIDDVKKSASVSRTDFTKKYGTSSEKRELESKSTKSYPSVKTITPTTKIDQNSIDKTYKDAVDMSLQLIYSEKSHSDNGSKFWEKNSGKPDQRRSGVINFKTVGEIAKDRLGIEKTEGGDWSILNYFNTQPKIREFVIDLYKKKNNLLDVDDLKKFKNWIIDNRHMLFDEKLGDAENFFDDFLRINIESYLNGVRNEKKAFDYVQYIISDNPSLEMGPMNLPGSPKDLKGIDFSVVSDGKEIETYQAKPFGGIEQIKLNGRVFYRVYSYNVNRLDEKPVGYFIFASHNKNNGVVVFDNIKDGYKIVPAKGSFAYIDFTYPPKSYDPNFNPKSNNPNLN